MGHVDPCGVKRVGRSDLEGRISCRSGPKRSANEHKKQRKQRQRERCLESVSHRSSSIIRWYPRRGIQGTEVAATGSIGRCYLIGQGDAKGSTPC